MPPILSLSNVSNDNATTTATTNRRKNTKLNKFRLSLLTTNPELITTTTIERRRRRRQHPNPNNTMNVLSDKIEELPTTTKIPTRRTAIKTKGQQRLTTITTMPHYQRNKRLSMRRRGSMKGSGSGSAGANEYDSQYIDSIKGLDSYAKTKLKRMRLNLRRDWLEKYYRDIQLKKSNLNISNYFPQQQQQHQHQHQQQQHPAVPPPPPPPPAQPPAPAPAPAQPPPARPPAADIASPQQHQYCQDRRIIEERDDLREILENYCNSDKSNADMQLFNRDYLQHIANMTNNIV